MAERPCGRGNCGDAKPWQINTRCRAPIRIEVKDATEFAIPEGDCVIFMYNPFGATTIEKIIQRVATSLTASARIVYVVYYNPTAAKVIDGSSALSRRSAQSIGRTYNAELHTRAMMWKVQKRR